MSRVDYQLVKEIFFAAKELEGAPRERFLEQVCAGEEGLRSEVQSLLRSSSETTDFLDRAACGRDRMPGSTFDLKFLLRHWRRYELEDCLGMGSQSLVYRATDRRDQRSVAIKLLVHLDRPAIIRFHREAASLMRIEHPAVLEIYDSGVVDGIPYLVMQLVEGPSLMGTRSGTSLEQRVELIRQVAWGLQAVHDLGIVHRDVKPDNILVEHRGSDTLRAYLADFGIACDRTGSRITRTGALIGTPSYIAPERLRRPALELDHRSDIYALGVTLYELLLGRTPYARSSTFETLLKIRDGAIDRPRREMPGLPRRLEAILLRCLAVEPDARYPSARALAEDLQRFLDGGPVRALTISESSPREGLKLGAVLGLAGRAAALLAGVAALRFVATRSARRVDRGTPGRI